MLKRFTIIFIKIVFNKNSPNCFCWKKVFQSIEFPIQSIECDSYFYYNWIQLFLVQLKSLTGSTVNSIDLMVCSINWTVTAKLFLKLIWVFKGMRIITFRIIKTKTFEKHSLRFSKRDIAPFVRSSFDKAFQIKKPPITWIFEAFFEWGSCYFGSGPKLSLLHLIFILCNLFCVEVLCNLSWSCWSVICLLFSITGFVIELVQWVSALVSHLLRGSVEGEWCREQCCLRTASVVVRWVSALVTH